MKKQFLTLSLLLVTFLTFSQTLLTPSQFLGYSLGSKFTYHHKIIDYTAHVASQRKTTTKIIPYGTTNEGRPLEIIIIGTPEAMQSLETIRTNNLKAIGLLEGKPTQSVPAIAWLSYNVHGNEAVSSEAYMQVLYDLVTENETSKQILKNTLVILDPCINPDGRDRYSNWYNRYMGLQQPDLSQASIEHHEPWPGGRFNHYLFDLNRDWAWQAQIESKQRIKIYQEWMPHLHADFHEMGANSTYYFPPSAQPYHEELTPYQREFQTLLGKFNKKRFDENGWLYYTKEDFDLLYPSYGDTFPSYNGAIGMTFEQGGSGRAGVAFLREDGDTLTLSDRIKHHYATSLGTLEAIASKPTETVTAFQNYFNDATQNGVGKYKTFVLKTNKKEQHGTALTELLASLKIDFSYANKKTTSKGFNYQTRKESSFEVEENDLLITTHQPKGKLVKILFEPETVVVDSNTYDITTWSLPYAYGISAFATADKISGNKTKQIAAISAETPQQAYAYIADYQSFEETKLLAHLLKNKIKVRVHSTPFKANGKNFKAGTLVITKKGNENLGSKFDEIVKNAAQKFNVTLHAIESGLVENGTDIGSNDVSVINAPKVAMLLGEGISPTAAGEVWHFFEQQIQYPITIIDQSYFSKVNLWDFQVLILPDGNYSKIIDEKEIARWLSDGGRLVALEGANNAFSGKSSFGLKPKTEKEQSKEKLKIYGERVRKDISDLVPGAIFKVTMDASHPLGYGFSDNYYALLKENAAFDYLENGWNVGHLTKDAYVTGFAGKNAKENLKETLVFGVETIGNGKIIYMLDNPLFRGFWYNGKQLFGNAVFMVK
jgi:Zinc carboxypeptidase